MKKCLFLVLILVFSATLTFATMYSCRDRHGKLYITDNIQSLPAECLGGKQKITYRDDPGQVSYVPTPDVPAGSGTEFEQAVANADQELKQKKALEEGLLSRARQLAEKYNQAQIERNAATRRWQYAGSRDAIRRAEKVMQDARAEKEEILAELEKRNISRNMEQEITDWLDKVGSE